MIPEIEWLEIAKVLGVYLALSIPAVIGIIQFIRTRKLTTVLSVEDKTP
jgi:hypothetical protein